MTEALRVWMGEKMAVHTTALDALNIKMEEIVLSKDVARRNIQTRLVEYVESLRAFADGEGGRVSVRDTARMVVRAIISMHDVARDSAMSMQEIQGDLERVRNELDALRVETLRELTRLRSNVRAADWDAPTNRPAVGTYYDNRPDSV
jgi:hypothetical protein